MPDVGQPLTQHSLLFSGENPTSYALLKGWDVNITRWTQAQRDEFVKWSNNMPEEEAGFGAYERPRPRAANAGEAFGPGPDEIYRGSYDGAGDTVVWPQSKGGVPNVSENWDGREQVDELIAENEYNLGMYDKHLARNDPKYWSKKTAKGNYSQSDSSAAPSEMSQPSHSPFEERYASYREVDSDMPASPFEERPVSEFQGTNASSEFQGTNKSLYDDVANSNLERGSRPASDPASVFDEHAATPYEIREPPSVPMGDVRPWYQRALGKKPSPLSEPLIELEEIVPPSPFQKPNRVQGDYEQKYEFEPYEDMAPTSEAGGDLLSDALSIGSGAPSQSPFMA